MKPAAERLAALLVSALAVAAAAGDDTDQTEVIEYRTRPQQNLIPDESIPVAPAAPAPPPAAPDDRTATREDASRPPPWTDDEIRLWRLLEQDRLAELDAGIATLRLAYPDWEPPPRLTRLAETRRQRLALSRARGENLIALAERYPERFSCQEVDNLWRLASAWEDTGHPDRARSVYGRILGECRDPGIRLATLQKAAGVLPAEEYLALLDRENAAAPDPVLAKMALGVRRGAATEAAESGHCPQALALLTPAEKEILRSRDVDGARILGWCLGETHRPVEALPWLERAAEWSGTGPDRLALAEGLVAVGDTERALALLEPLAVPDPGAARLARDLWARRAAKAMDAGDCDGALADLDQAERFGRLAEAEVRLRGWALYDCSRYQQASEVFTAAYADTGDAEAARGLLLSDYRRHDLSHALAVARERSGPLAGLFPAQPLPRRGGRIDYERVTLDDDGRLAVVTVREWAAFAGAGWSTRQGDGPSELDAWRLPVVEFEYQYDRHRFDLDVARIDLDSGDMGPGDFPVNTDRITATAITKSESGLWEPTASWTFDSDLNWHLGVGTTPLEGEVSATWQGRAGVSMSEISAGWSLAAVRTPVEESVLSWTGVRGAVQIDGQAVALPFSWGRVTRNGVDAGGYRKLNEDWTISGDLRFGRYVGHNVKDNTGGQFYGLAEKRLAGEGPSGLWGGPYVYLSAFGNNSNHFTPGYGGYFSPSWLAGGGLAGRWRKESSDDPWYLEIRGSAGYQAHEEDSSDLIGEGDLEQQVLDLLQLTPADLGRFGSNSEQGFAGSLEIEGLRRIGASRWYVGGMLRGRVSPEYDNAAAMLVVRYGSRQPGHSIKRQYRELFAIHD